MDRVLEFFNLLFADSQPIWLKAWLSWIMVLNTLSILFLKKNTGRFIFGAWNLVGATMIGIFVFNGFNRLLGLAHIIWWTPLLIYMYKEKSTEMDSTTYQVWYKALFFTIFASLVIDYIDLIRYFS